MMNKLFDYIFNSFVDYPLSWTYSFSMMAFQPIIGEFVPIFTQVILLLCIHLVTVFIDWLRKRLKVSRKQEYHHMDILHDLEEMLLRRKDLKKEEKNR